MEGGWIVSCGREYAVGECILALVNDGGECVLQVIDLVKGWRGAAGWERTGREEGEYVLMEGLVVITKFTVYGMFEVWDTRSIEG